MKIDITMSYLSIKHHIDANYKNLGYGGVG